MDRQNFDQLTKNLAARTSRRTLLRGLLGGAAMLGSRQTVGSLAAEPSDIGTGKTIGQCVSNWDKALPGQGCCSGNRDVMFQICLPDWLAWF